MKKRDFLKLTIIGAAAMVIAPRSLAERINYTGVIPVLEDGVYRFKTENDQGYVYMRFGVNNKFSFLPPRETVDIWFSDIDLKVVSSLNMFKTAVNMPEGVYRPTFTGVGGKVIHSLIITSHPDIVEMLWDVSEYEKMHLMINRKSLSDILPT